MVSQLQLPCPLATGGVSKDALLLPTPFCCSLGAAATPLQAVCCGLRAALTMLQSAV